MLTEMKLSWCLLLIIFATDAAIAARKGCRVGKGKLHAKLRSSNEGCLCSLYLASTILLEKHQGELCVFIHVYIPKQKSALLLILCSLGAGFVYVIVYVKVQCTSCDCFETPLYTQNYNVRVEQMNFKQLALY